MSKFVEFYNKVRSDDSLRAEFAGVMKEQGVAVGAKFTDLDEKVLAALEPLALRAGIGFKLDEAIEYFSRKEDGVLSDFELEAVAGGAKYIPEVEYIYQDAEGSHSSNG
ncbi:MAG: hypothetical protein LBS75_10225 [Synergistaceae bacterium]|nr:hypothetical protein [Synergistaceae bacterium]